MWSGHCCVPGLPLHLPHEDWGKGQEKEGQSSGMSSSYSLSIGVSIFFLLAINTSPSGILIKLLS